MYFYAATVLTQFGYISYFGIPSNFIESSLKDNIVYFYNLFQVISTVFGLMKWWTLLGLISIGVMIFFLYWGHYRFKQILSFVGTFILILLLRGTYDFGNLLAANSTTFLTLPDDCQFESAGTSTRYIIPTLFETNAVLVPYGVDDHKIHPGFLLRAASDIPCAIERKEVGSMKR